MAAPSALIYLGVDDVRVTIDAEPHLVYRDDEGAFGESGWEAWMAFRRDSEGNLVGLASRNPSA
jgi:methylmalonyl-CoA/ethylmalonyl-CoA epimerase